MNNINQCILYHYLSNILIRAHVRTNGVVLLGQSTYFRVRKPFQNLFLEGKMHEILKSNLLQQSLILFTM